MAQNLNSLPALLHLNIDPKGIGHGPDRVIYT